MPRRNTKDARSEMDESIAEDREETGGNKTRNALIVILVILFILLIAIMSFVFRVITPTVPEDVRNRTEGLTWVRSIYGISARAEDQLKSPAHTAIGPDGTIWVTDSVMNRVLGFNPDGSFSRELKAAGEDPMASMMQGPAGIAVSEDGEVYVASNLTDVVIVWGRDGEVDRAFEVPAPIQIALQDDRVFITSAEGLFLYTTAGEQVAKWSARGAADDQVDMPNGAVIGEDGALYITDTHNNQLKAYSADGGELLWVVPETSARAGVDEGTAVTEPLEMGDIEESHPETSTGGEQEEDLTKSLQLPTGMAMDNAGRLVFADAFAFGIFVADPSTGELLAKYGDQGSGDGLFNYPTGISYDPDRDWFAVADTANGRVQIVRIEGSGGSPLAAVRRIQVPWGVCAAPLILLVIIVLLAMTRKRARGARDEAAQNGDFTSEDAL